MFLQADDIENFHEQVKVFEVPQFFRSNIPVYSDKERKFRLGSILLTEKETIEKVRDMIKVDLNVDYDFKIMKRGKRKDEIAQRVLFFLNRFFKELFQFIRRNI